MKGDIMTMAIKQTGTQIKAAMSGEKVKLCQRCGNQYILIWLKQSDDYNDFALRHCPFCGLMTDEITGSVII
jgi:hypothetical protein